MAGGVCVRPFAMEEDVLMAFQGLMSYYVAECTLLEKARVPDGEGGWTVSWTDGMKFQAAITHDDTMQARVAESEGMGSTFSVFTDKSMPLDYHDVFRRESDGQVFRVTSQGGDEVTPDSSNLDLCKVSAERWVLS